jgi:selenocysteine lyase/cysteine desulfurase
MAGFIGLGASLEVLQSFGLSNTDDSLGKHVVDVTDLMVGALQKAGAVVHSERGPEISSGIVLLEVPGKEPVEVRKALLENKVITSCRGGHVRAAAHGYNNENDIDRLVETIKQM